MNVSATAVVIGSSTCNDFQNIEVASATTTQFTVYVDYGTQTQQGNWLYATIDNAGTTSTSAPFTASTNSNGVVLRVGLNNAIGAVTPEANVVLTPQGGSPVTIQVNYTQNSSCGGNTGQASNGFFSLTPGNVSLSGSQLTQSVTIQNASGTAFTFTPTVTSNGGWLTVTYNSVTLSANGTNAVTLTAIPANATGAGPFTGYLTITPQAGFGQQLTIPVTYTSGSGTGTPGNNNGTLTVNGGSSATVNFLYVAPNLPSGNCVALVDPNAATSGSYYSWSVSTVSNGNWLLANNSVSGSTPQLLGQGNNACIELDLNPGIAANLPSGAYQGAVVVTSSSGSTATINVNFFVSAGIASGITVAAQGQSGSGAIYVFPNVAANSTVIQNESFTISAPNGYNLGLATLNSASGGFSMTTPSVNNNTETFTVTSNSTGLPAGVYATTITVPSSYNNTSANSTITVVLPVGQQGSTSTGGNTTTTTVAPTALTFQQQQGDTYWSSRKEAQAITITGTQGTSWTASVVYAAGGSNWLTFDNASSGTFGSGPATLMVDLFNGIGTLPASFAPYQATIDITTTSGLYTVSVSLLVTATNQPVLLANPASATFSLNSGASVPSQTITVVGSDNTTSTTNPPIVAGAPTATWLSATTNGNQLTLSINNTVQTTGVYSATVPISASAYTNTINYPVVLIVNGGSSTGTTGPLTLSSTALNYTNVTGQITQNLGVTATTATAFTVSSNETTCQSSNWLVVTNTNYTASPTLYQVPVTVNPSGVTNGTTCTGVITLTTASAAQTVSVSMTVGSSATGSGNVTVTPSTMTFAYVVGQALPNAQTASITNATTGTASIPFNVTTTENNGTTVNWLTTNVSSAATPYSTLSVAVTPGNLPPATYTGVVTITPTGGSAQVINVTMTVSNTVTVTASPTTLNLAYTVGGNAPTGTLSVAAGGATAGFTASATSNGGWLQVTPTTGTTPNTGTFSVNVSTVSTALASLLPSTTPYTGSITVTGTSPATGTTMINVSLTITAPLPAISGVINAASGATGAVAPGEIISLFAPNNGQSPFGPATAVPLSSTTCPSPCTSVPTNMGGVQVLFLPGSFPAPLLYVSSSQINAVVPYEMAGINNLSVEVKYLGQVSNAFPLSLASTSPGLFVSAGSTQAAAYQYDPQGNGSYNTSASPAKAGYILVLYLTGEGVVVPAAADGAVTVAKSTQPYTPVPAAGAPSVRIGNQPANVLFYGEAPGFVSGLMQLNVVVPAGAGTGNQPVSVTIGNNSSQSGVTVALQ